MGTNTQRTFRTSRTLTISKMYRKYEDWDAGDIIIGKIVGHHTDNYGKRCRIVNVLDAQLKKPSEAKKYQDKNLVINSSGKLDKALESLNGEELGVIMQITYLGSNLIDNPKHKFNGKMAHDIDVQIVEEDDGGEEVEL